MVDIVHTLQSAGIRGKDLAQVRVRKRVIFLHDMHSIVRDAVREVELNEFLCEFAPPTR